MFTVEERNRVRERLLERARDDPAIAAAAITGSYVADGGDEWSDIDLAFGIRGDVSRALGEWTQLVYDDFGALHHWDLPWGTTVYRVFLLPDSLQVDIAFTPATEFGPRGPNWRTVFGETVDAGETSPPGRDELVGWAWTYVLHARACINRGRPWQAESSISAARDNVIALACLRLDLPTRFGRGADALPAEVTEPLEPALVRSLDEPELRRALAVVAGALVAEVERNDATLAERLRPVLAEAGGLSDAASVR